MILYLFYVAALLILAAFVAAGTFIGRASTPRDYSLGGRKSSAAGVTGILLGALVGGASTVGTVQMAYSYGLTALWFTLGGGIGCLLLGLRFAVPLRNSGITTVADYLAGSYGGSASSSWRRARNQTRSRRKSSGSAESGNKVNDRRPPPSSWKFTMTISGWA